MNKYRDALSLDLLRVPREAAPLLLKDITEHRYSSRI